MAFSIAMATRNLIHKPAGSISWPPIKNFSFCYPINNIYQQHESFVDSPRLLGLGLGKENQVSNMEGVSTGVCRLRRRVVELFSRIWSPQWLSSDLHFQYLRAHWSRSKVKSFSEEINAMVQRNLNREPEVHEGEYNEEEFEDGEFEDIDWDDEKWAKIADEIYEEESNYKYPYDEDDD